MLIITLRSLFALILLVMLGINGFAMMHENLFQISKQVTGDPWFIATLFDAYAGFITFYTWVCYRENGLARKLIWLILILLLGNIAMATYMLILLFRLPKTANPKEILLKTGD